MQERLSVRSYIMKTCTGDPMAAYRILRPEPQISVNLLKLTSEKKKESIWHSVLDVPREQIRCSQQQQEHTAGGKAAAH